MLKLSAFTFIVNSFFVFAQNPGDALNPMTAPGASGIRNYNHILFWDNPDSVVFNMVYFSDDSLKIASLDSSAIIYDGYPSTVFDSVGLNIFGSLQTCGKYYWRVVEYHGEGTSNGETWWFSAGDCVTGFFDDFENGLSNWTITTESGCPWDAIPIASRSYMLPNPAFGNAFASDADLCGSSGGGSSGTATVMISNPPNQAIGGTIEWDNDWFPINTEDSAFVDVSYDYGSSWINIATFNSTEVRNTHESYFVPNLYTGQSYPVRFKTVQPGWDWWWAVDNVMLTWLEVLTPPLPPSLLKAKAGTEEQKVTLNWNNGSSPDPVNGYRIQRKTGLPTDQSIYETIAEPGVNDFTYNDLNVNLNEIYTYRIATISGPPGSISDWGNEATAYVPAATPVELISFTASVSKNGAVLNWSTATETNNRGFEIERSTDKAEWSRVGFVGGRGTTTEPQHYSYTDNLPGASLVTYYYRLKQVDFNGAYKYSSTVEAEFGPSEFTLSQNYPNPFNPTTSISYQLPVNSFVSLKVYDVLGNEVSTLVNEQKAAGEYSAVFNASALGSGVYFYVLKAGNFLQSRKMMLVK